MRFGLQHNGRYALFGCRPRFTLRLSIDFSDEERAIAAVRALHNYVFDLSPGYLATTETRHSQDSIGAMSIGGLALFGAGLVCMAIAAAVPSVGALAMIGLVGGPALWFYAQLAFRHEEQSYVKAVSLGFLLANPSIAIQADNPGQAPLLDANIRSRLADLKAFLTATHELATPRQFEL
jgi:hypothetical protein